MALRHTNSGATPLILDGGASGMSPHGALTHDSVSISAEVNVQVSAPGLTECHMSDSRHLHLALTSGREGKGREQGRGREGKNYGWLKSSFIVTYIGRERRSDR